MNPPFTVSQFLKVFEEYNTAVFPAQIIFYLIAAAVMVFVFRKKYNALTGSVISFFWFWMGAVYHIAFFTSINKAAYVFGILFMIQSLLTLYFTLRKKLSFAFAPDVYGFTGTLLIAYALIVYPVIGSLAGHGYPQSPLLGLPCPTAIFTFGLFIMADKKFPTTLIIIPFIWSIVGFTAALNFGIKEDIGLLVSGITALILIIFKNRKFSKTQVTGKDSQT